MIAIVAIGSGADRGHSSFLLKDCSNPEDIAAIVQATDHVTVRHGIGGGSETCYAVTATVGEKKIEGYLLGSAHPDVAAFEREARSHIPELPPPPPPTPPPLAPAVANPDGKENGQAPAPEPPKSFAGLSGSSPAGGRVSLDSLSQPTLVLYFWSANDKNSVREAEAMEGVYNTYGGKRVGLLGVVSGRTPQVRKAISDNEVIWPQILDSESIAARYPRTNDLKYFILDRKRNVVAALKSSEDVKRALQRQYGGSK